MRSAELPAPPSATEMPIITEILAKIMIKIIDCYFLLIRQFEHLVNQAMAQQEPAAEMLAQTAKALTFLKRSPHVGLWSLFDSLILI